MKVDILAIGVHPDDVELACSGTILKHINLGKKVGILDLTQGELGTRGTAETRKAEATASAKILGIAFRDNLGMKDGFFVNDQEHQLQIIKKIRQYQPEIVLCNAVSDRHPDHGRASQLVEEACFYSGLIKVETELDGKKQLAWRPTVVYHYIQDRYIRPDFVVDITPFFEKKMKSIQAFSTQFFDPNSKEPITPISSKDFINSVESRMRDYGRNIGVTYAEGFTCKRFIGINNFFDLI